MAVATAVQPYRQIVDGKLQLFPHAGQWRAWQSLARYILILSGAQGGKTCFAVDWLRREIETCGEGDYMLVSPTYPLLSHKLLPEFLSVFQDTLKLGRYKDSDKVFEYKNGKTRVMMGYAANPDSLESATAKAAVLDEVGQKSFKRESHEAIQRRLAIHRGRCLYATTPYTLGWLKDEVYERCIAKHPDYDLINFPSTANPMFSREEFEEQRAKMPGWKFRMFYEGKFEHPVGLVFDTFDRALDVVDRFPIPANWLWYAGHDFGSANPAAILYAQDPATGLIFRVHTYLPGGKSISQQVLDLKELTKGRTVIMRVGGAHQETGWRDAYSAQGWPISEPPQPGLEVQIGRAYPWHSKHRVKTFSDLHDFIDEIESFSYELDDKFKPTDKIENEANYHLQAADRYFLSSLPAEVSGTANRGPRVNAV